MLTRPSLHIVFIVILYYVSKTFLLGREKIMLLETLTARLARVQHENIALHILISNGSSIDEDEGGLGRGGVSSSSKHVSV